jgi:sec-independent protein translocase protein TatA
MFGLSHLPEILALLLLALLVFGPKRMIEMGSSFGKMFREFRDAAREMNWSNLVGDHDDTHQSRQGPLARASQTFQSFSAARADREEAQTAAPTGATVVESTIEQPKERHTP